MPRLTEREWHAKFGRAHYRIAGQIIPAFPDAVVVEARSLADASCGALLYIPPEAAAT